MSSYTSSRLAELDRSPTVALLDEVQRLRKAGADVLNLSGGEPNFTTPSHIAAAAVRALSDGLTHYTPSSGLPELRVAIASKLLTENGIAICPDEGVIVTPSAKHALFLCMAAVLDAGDEVLLPSPHWVSYGPMASMLGAQPIDVPLSSTEGFALTADRLRAAITPRTRAIVLNTPNNPTGRVLSHEEAADVARVACEHDLVIITDEIYEHIRYGGRPHLSMAAQPGCADRTLTVNGFSKAYAMTGWRLGYVAGPAAMMRQLLKAQEHTVGCAASFAQWGGLAALTGPQRFRKEMRTSYDARRQLVVRALNEMPGIECPDPEGAFYVLPNVAGLGMSDGIELCSWLLRHAGVALTPGEAFGGSSTGYVRLSFAAAPEVLELAVNRIGNAVASLPVDGSRLVVQDG